MHRWWETPAFHELEVGVVGARDEVWGGGENSGEDRDGEEKEVVWWMHRVTQYRFGWGSM